MTISHRSVAALEVLSAAVAELVEAVGARRAAGDVVADRHWTVIVETIERYVELVERGRASDDPVPALKGASLLATLKKGIGDAAQEPGDRVLEELALVVPHQAIDAARHLRDDAGIVLG